MPNKIDFAPLAEQVMQRCDQLGAISQAEYVDRRYLTPQHAEANRTVAQWMEQAGMQTWQDAAGNLWGRYDSSVPNAKRFILGSHLDTVPNGGKYDGMLGVVSPIALVSQLQQRDIALPFHLDVVGFGDEEGTRFGSTLLGSRAIAGTWNKEWAHLTDENNITLRQAMSEFGLDIDQIDQAGLTTEDLLGYLELHIEQGPVLEQHELPVGVVSAIAGARRFQISVKGMAGHAGTVPMTMRADALCAAAKMILTIEEAALSAGVVATVGQIQNHPNGVNVIPGDVTFSLDIRSEHDNMRDGALDFIETRLADIANDRNVSVSYRETHSAPAVHCAAHFQQALRGAIKSCGIEPMTLPSGAGHDAMAMADICPVAMLFMRCNKGISHHPGEAIKTDDVRVSLDVMYRFLMQMAAE